MRNSLYTIGDIYQPAPERQVFDNKRHPDAKQGKDGNRKSGSLYDLIPAVPQNCKPAGEWNNVEIMHKKGYVGLQDHGDKVWNRNIQIKEL